MKTKRPLIKLLSIIILTFFFGIIRGQDTVVVYFDNDWEICNKELASYYRKYFKNDSKKWDVKDYFINGQIQMKGTYKKRNWKKKDGHFIYYLENGQKEYEGNFTENIKTGSWIYWHTNGEISSNGKFIDGKRDGVWYWYFDNEQISAKEVFTDGERTEYNFWDENGNIVKLEDAEYLPQFPGGWDAYSEFIKTNTIYPAEAKLRGVQGSVIVTLIVDSSGEIENVLIQNPINTFLDKEALRVARLLPNFIPGKQHNRFVKVSYNAPFTFRL